MKKLFKGVLAMVVLLSLMNSVASAGDGFGSTAPKRAAVGGESTSSFMLGCNRGGC
jgi:hypothetical protein